MNFMPSRYNGVYFSHEDAVKTLHVGVLAGGANASISYFIEPYLASKGMICTLMDSRFPQEISVSCHAIVIVRYLPDSCISGLRDFKRRGGKLIYFMDDDLMDTAALATMPEKYATKIKATAVSKRRIIEELCSEFWVSSPYLAHKYSEWNPVLLPPNSVGMRLQNVCSAFSVCYHGTASHRAEIEWLVPIASALQIRSNNIVFELFGDHDINKMYREIPGVAVLHPMSWSNYLAYTTAMRRDIALAPLLPSKFNAARGPTKFFDFTRMNAVGIYSEVSPYDGYIRNGIDGVLLPNEKDAWVEAILALLQDPEKKDWMVNNARKRVGAIT